METIGELFYELSGQQREVAVFVIYIIALVSAYRYLKNEKELNLYLRAPRFKVCAGLMLLGHFLLLGSICDSASSMEKRGMILGANLLLDTGMLLYLRFVPSSARRRLDGLRRRYRHDSIEWHRQLEQFPTEHLTPQDEKHWSQLYYMNLYNLGSINKAVEIMSKVEEEGSPQERMLLSFRAEARGDIEGAREKMLQAKDALRPADSDFLRAQILNNCGRCYRMFGNNDTALHYYNEAADLIVGGTDIEVVHIVYSNLIIESCIMMRSMEEIELLMEQYAHYIHFDNVEEVVEYDNLRLAVARQTGDVKLAERIIEESYDRTCRLLVSSGDRKKLLHYMISSLRVAHMARLELDKYMLPVCERFEDLKSLDMPDRYYMMKELFLLCQEPPMVSPVFKLRYGKLFEEVFHYILEEAAGELEVYLQNIPSAAVYGICHTQEEIAWIWKFKSDYDFDDVSGRLTMVIDRYKSQDLRLEAIICRGKLISEMISPQNLSDDFVLRQSERLRKEIVTLEEEVKHIRYHLGCAGTFLVMAHAAIFLQDYNRCLKFSRLFEKCEVHENHLTVWDKENLSFVKLVARTWKIHKGLLRLKGKIQNAPDISVKAGEWIRKYPDVNSEEVTLLLAMMLDMPKAYAKVVSWAEVLTSGIVVPGHHWWLMYGEQYPVCENNSLVEIDLCYRKVSNASDGGRVFFFPGRHPLQTLSTVWTKEHVKSLPEQPHRLDFLVSELKLEGEEKYKHLSEIKSFLQQDCI